MFANLINESVVDTVVVLTVVVVPLIIKLPVTVRSPESVPPAFGSALLATSNAVLACKEAPLAYNEALEALFTAVFEFVYAEFA